MSNENQQLPKPRRTVQLSSDPMEQAEQAKDAHVYTVGGMIIGAIADAKGFLKTPDIATASMVAEGFLTELVRSIRPRDGVEEMLVVQMAMVHQRIGNLSLQAAEQSLTKNVAVINQAVDGACNVFRRQMLALAEYRRATQPKASAPTRSAEDSQDDSGANEQGSPGEAPAALPVVGSRPGVPACVGDSLSTVGEQHGSANGSRQVALKAQRAETRALPPGPARRTSPTQRVDASNARRRRRAQ